MIEWGTKGKASVLVDGQFGSTGKGLASAWLSGFAKIDIATADAGAQAGHTTVLPDGSKFVCYHLPTTAVMQKRFGNADCIAYVNAGSIIDIDALDAEVLVCGAQPAQIVVHPRAAVITDDNKAQERDPESSTAKIASTQKGVGRALSDKIMRRAKLAGDYRDRLKKYRVEELDLNTSMHRNLTSVVVEVPQGLDLSLNHGGTYPYTTSRDCFVGSGISDACVHPSFVGPIVMVVRTFPIRVGSLYNELGEFIGTSGPFYDDSVELSWEKDFPGVEPERTTVTKRVRRIATWSNRQYERSLKINRPTVVFLNFCNYIQSAIEFSDHVRGMKYTEGRTWARPEHVYSFGPATSDVVTSYDEAITWFDKRRF